MVGGSKYFADSYRERASGGHVATQLAAAAAATTLSPGGAAAAAATAVATAADAHTTHQTCNVIINACRTRQGYNQGRNFFFLFFSSPTEVPLACSHAESSFLG